MQILETQKPIFVALTMAACMAFLIVSVMTRHSLAQGKEKTSALVVRVAVFPADRGGSKNIETLSTVIFSRRRGASPGMWAPSSVATRTVVS